MSVIGRGISDNEAWADMTDAQRWAYARRLEDAVTETVKELGTLRQQHRGAVSREHAAQAIGWLSAEVAVHGAPELGPEWLELWECALTATGEQ